MEKISALKFPTRCHLGFHDVTALSLLWKAEVLLLETIGQRSDIMKSKMVARRKFKSRNLFRLLLLNVAFSLSSKICNLGIIWSNLGSTRASSRGSL